MIIIEKLKNVIKQGQKFYYSSKRYIQTFYDAERWWAVRHLRKGGEEWIQGVWDSRSHPHRELLLQKVEAYAPVSSILEVGCCCGVNLALCAKRFPHAEIRGIDINPKAVENGNQWLLKEGFSNVELAVGRADRLAHIPDKKFDVLLIDVMFVHIPPRKIRKVIRELLRVTRRVLILCEPGDLTGKDKDGSGVYYEGPTYKWGRNYSALLEQFVSRERIQVTRFTPSTWPESEKWQEHGVLIEVNLQ